MKKKQENPQKSSLLGQLSALEIDGQLTTSVRRASHLRAICSSFGLQWGKKFSVSTNREQRTITATRIS